MLINSLVNVTVLLSDLIIPFALQDRLYYFKFTTLKNHVNTSLDVVLEELQIFQQENLLQSWNIVIPITLEMLLGILGYQSINDHHLGLE